MTKLIKISVIISTYNQSKLLSFCLESLENQTLSRNKYEVIIINNNCTDNTDAIAKEFVRRNSNFILSHEKKQGIIIARNAGVKLARGRFVAFIDDDAKAHEDWLELMLKTFEEVKPSPSVIGGKILPYYPENKPAWFLDKYEIRTKGEDAKFLNLELSGGFSGSNFAVEKDVFNKVGGFSVNFGLRDGKLELGEEADLFKRISKLNLNFFYNPKLQVNHFTPLNKMTVKYRLFRAFKASISYVRIYYARFSAFKLMLMCVVNVGRIFYNLPLSIILVRWYSYKWKRDFLKHAIPIFLAIGKIKGIFILSRNKLKK